MRLRILVGILFFAAYAELPTAGFSQSKPQLTGGVARPESEEAQLLVRTILIRPKKCETELSSRFFPSQDQLTQGIAAPIFLRMNWEATQRMKVLRELHAHETLDTPLDEFNTEAIDKTFPINVDEMDRAVFRERAGWEYPLHEEPRIRILLPDAQESRLYVHAMLLKARSLIKHGKIDEAERMLCLVMGLARHIGETPFVVCRLVQYAETNGAVGVAEELLQHPQAPNYYWDLVSLPRHFIDVRTAIQFESEMLANSIAGLKDLESLKTEEQWNTLANTLLWELRASADDATLPKPGTPEAAQAIKDWVALSRERLPKIAPQHAPRLPQMSDAEVGVRYWWLRVQARTKSHLALHLLEPQYAIPKVIADVERLRKDAEDELPVRMASPLPSAFIVAAALLDQKIVMLRAIESIRDYAATHEGKLPRSLAELELPVPNDPVSGEALKYDVAAKGLTATLSGATVETSYGWFPSSPELQKKVVKGMRYELKIAER